MNTPVMDRKLEEVKTEEGIETETAEMQSEANAKLKEEPEQPATYVNLDPGGEQPSMYMNLNAEGELDSAEGELDEPEWAEGGEGGETKKGPQREVVTDRRMSHKQRREKEKQERDREKQLERERKQREKKEEKERKLKEKSKSPPPNATHSPLLSWRGRSKSPSPIAPSSPSLPTKERSKSPAPKAPNSPSLPTRDKTVNGAEDAALTLSASSEQGEDDGALRASEVVVIKQPNLISACGQPIDVVFDARNAGEGSLSASCKGTKVAVVETSVLEEANGQYRVQFTPGTADVYMLSVRWCGKDVTGSPFLINLNLLPSAPDTEEKHAESNGGEQLAEEKEEREREGQKENTRQEEKRSEETEEQAKRVSQEFREKSPAIVVSDDPFDMAYEASRLLGE